MERLQDGSAVVIRPIGADDRAALDAFHEGLSSRTVYLRFFGVHPHLTEADLDFFTGVDHEQRVALVACAADAVVAVGRFDVVGDGSAEVAFVVTDEMQGRGLGGLLLERLVDIGRSLGVERFVADVLPGNVRMLEMFRHSGHEVTQTHVDDVIQVSVLLAPLELSSAHGPPEEEVR